MLVATPRLVVAAVAICALWAAVGWPWWTPAAVFTAALIVGEWWARRRRGRREQELWREDLDQFPGPELTDPWEPEQR